MTKVTVQVPATSANLGPGFDSLGLALDHYDDVTVELTESGVEVSIEGEGTELASLGERHLIVKVVRQALDRISALTGSEFPQPGLRLSCVNRIPHSRGLGSSSAAIVAGIVAAKALHPRGAEFGGELALATEIEGHPDNVAPCLAGGLTVAWTGADGPRLVRLDLEKEVVVFIPDQRLATERARGLLPATVSHHDAAANSGRAALLIAALTTKLGDEVLLAATEDRLHQSYRAPAMPESAALVDRLRNAGVPAVISGAGPTVLAFGSATTTSRLDSIARELGSGWHMRPLSVAPLGARVQSESRTR
ncbi:MAG: homoserine kinase [Streptosporangiaceae bacterium]